METWVDPVLALYMRTEEMTVSELEGLLVPAVRGERPDDRRLPMYLPFELETVMR